MAMNLSDSDLEKLKNKLLGTGGESTETKDEQPEKLPPQAEPFDRTTQAYKDMKAAPSVWDAISKAGQSPDIGQPNAPMIDNPRSDVPQQGNIINASYTPQDGALAQQQQAQPVDPNTLIQPNQPQAATGVPMDMSGFGMQMQAAKEKGLAESEAAKQTAKVYADQVLQREEIAKMQETQAKAQEARIVDYNKKVEDQYNKYSDMKLSTDHFWAEKSTGSKVLAAIGIALGAIGQGLSMGKMNSNPALDVINKAIDQDLNIQRANIEKVGKGVEFKKGLMADNMKQFNDIDTAHIASKIQLLQKTQDQINQITSQSASQTTQANAKATIGALKTQQATLQAKLNALAARSGAQTQGLQASMDNLDRLTVQSKHIGKEAAIPLLSSEAKEKANIINATIDQTLADNGTSPRLVKQLGEAYHIDSREILKGGEGFKKKIEALKRNLLISAQRKAKTNNASSQISDLVDEEL